MKCREIQQRILDWEGENNPGRPAEVEDHLRACPECRRFGEQMRRAWDAMGSMPEIEPSPNFNAATWDKIRSRRNTLEVLSVFVSGRWRWVMAGAAVILIGLAAGWLSLRPVPPAPVPRVAASGSSDLEDNQLLMEIDSLVNEDESRLLSTFQEWDTSTDAGNGPAEKVPQPERETRPPERLNFNREGSSAHPDAA